MSTDRFRLTDLEAVEQLQAFVAMTSDDDLRAGAVEFIRRHQDPLAVLAFVLCVFHRSVESEARRDPGVRGSGPGGQPRVDREGS